MRLGQAATMVGEGVCARPRVAQVGVARERGAVVARPKEGGGKG